MDTLKGKDGCKVSKRLFILSIVCFRQKKSFVYSVPLKRRRNFTLVALKEFAKEIGMLASLIIDPDGKYSNNFL